MFCFSEARRKLYTQASRAVFERRSIFSEQAGLFRGLADGRESVELRTVAVREPVVFPVRRDGRPVCASIIGQILKPAVFLVSSQELACSEVMDVALAELLRNIPPDEKVNRHADLNSEDVVRCA